MLSYGEIRRGIQTCPMYKSHTPVPTTRRLTASSETHRQWSFRTAPSTTLAYNTANTTRLDKQNPRGSVAFSGFAGGGALYDSLSLQTGGQSLGVLFSQTEFAAGYGFGTIPTARPNPIETDGADSPCYKLQAQLAAT